MIWVRYGIPAALAVAALVVLLAVGGSTGLEVFFMFLGASLSVLLLNVLFRVGVSGDEERRREEEAREYLRRHGRWPDD